MAAATLGPACTTSPRSPSPPAGITQLEGESEAARDRRHVWSKAFGGPSTDNIGGIALDRAGNIYLAGSFRDEIDFGGGALESLGDTDAFLASLAPDGAHRWSHRFGATRSDRAVDVAAASAETIAVIGDFPGNDLNAIWEFSNKAVFPSGSQKGLSSYLGVFNAAGDYLWSRRLTNADAFVHARALAADAAGNLYIAGRVGGNADFGTGILRTSSLHDDGFVGSWTSGGDPRWVRRFGGPDVEHVHALALNPAGGVFVAGEFAGDADFGGGGVANRGLRDGFVVSFSADGRYRWSTQFGTRGVDRVLAVAPDADGGVIVVGRHTGTLVIGSVKLGGDRHSLDADIPFVMGLSDDGTPQWGFRADGARCLGVGDDRRVHVLGAPDDEKDGLALGTFVNGTEGIQLAPFGNGFRPIDYPTAIEVAHDGSLLLAGQFSRAISLGGPMLKSAGDYDFYVARVRP